jgi:predicted transcriptional regulator
MNPLSNRQQKILQAVLFQGALQSSSMHEALCAGGEDVSLVTVKREIAELVEKGMLVAEGAGRSAQYTVSIAGRVHANVSAKEYCAVEPDKRSGMQTYNFEMFAQFPNAIFTEEEHEKLTSATEQYNAQVQHASPVAEKKELERLVIELSWKSSRIEGNTYTLLDTEKLLIDGIEAPGHAKEEAVMIINHKRAFEYIREYKTTFKAIDRKKIEDVHALLTDGMGVEKGVRNSLVGIVGTRYRPLDTKQQIEEAIAALSAAVDRCTSPYAKALLALCGIAYIQPFADGNKRTSRLIANAVLMAHGCAPLSYRSVDEYAYREAMLVYYELGSMVPIKQIFIEQYVFAATHYAVA